MEPIASSETSAIRTQTPGNYPKRNKLHYTLNFFLQNFILKIVCSNCLVFSCHYCTICFSLDVANFSQRYDCSMSTSFSSNLRGNCPCILFQCHLSLVFSAVLSYIFLVSFCTSVLRHLAVYNTVQSVWCWCVLTICISGNTCFSKYPINFVISISWAASKFIKPFPPCLLGTYKRSTSAFD